MDGLQILKIAFWNKLRNVGNYKLHTTPYIRKSIHRNLQLVEEYKGIKKYSNTLAYGLGKCKSAIWYSSNQLY